MTNDEKLRSINKDAASIAELTVEELRQLDSELADEISVIKYQLVLAHETRDKHNKLEDPSWYVRALHAKRMKDKFMREVRREIMARQSASSKKKERHDAHVEQMVTSRFVKIARKVLNAETFDHIMALAMGDDAHTQPGRWKQAVQQKSETTH